MRTETANVGVNHHDRFLDFQQNFYTARLLYWLWYEFQIQKKNINSSFIASYKIFAKRWIFNCLHRPGSVSGFCVLKLYFLLRFSCWQLRLFICYVVVVRLNFHFLPICYTLLHEKYFSSHVRTDILPTLHSTTEQILRNKQKLVITEFCGSVVKMKRLKLKTFLWSDSVVRFARSTRGIFPSRKNDSECVQEGRSKWFCVFLSCNWLRGMNFKCPVGIIKPLKMDRA